MEVRRSIMIEPISKYELLTQGLKVSRINRSLSYARKRSHLNMQEPLILFKIFTQLWELGIQLLYELFGCAHTR